MLYTVVYISRATQEMTQEELEKILSTSRKNNTSKSITGMLLFKDDEFMQALEGDKDSVVQLMKTIAGDSRHDEVLVLAEKNIPHRYFKNWSMGFDNLNESKKEGQINPEGFFSKSFKQNDTAHNFLRSFYKTEV